MTAQFDTDAGVAAWIRENIMKLVNTEDYAPGPEGDADLIDDFQLVLREYTQACERAALMRIKAANAVRNEAAGAEARRRAVPERDVSLPWLSGE